jgi:hypothetical protein
VYGSSLASLILKAKGGVRAAGAALALVLALALGSATGAELEDTEEAAPSAPKACIVVRYTVVFLSHIDVRPFGILPQLPGGWQRKELPT